MHENENETWIENENENETWIESVLEVCTEDSNMALDGQAQVTHM